MSKQVTRPATVRKARTAAPSATVRLYALLPGMRPTSGPRLLSHTAAALEILGITRTRSAPARLANPSPWCAATTTWTSWLMRA
jgi:hypothetical protein